MSAETEKYDILEFRPTAKDILQECWDDVSIAEGQRHIAAR